MHPQIPGLTCCFILKEHFTISKPATGTWSRRNTTCLWDRLECKLNFVQQIQRNPTCFTSSLRWRFAGTLNSRLFSLLLLGRGGKDWWMFLQNTFILIFLLRSEGRFALIRTALDLRPSCQKYIEPVRYWETIKLPCGAAAMPQFSDFSDPFEGKCPQRTPPAPPHGQTSQRPKLKVHSAALCKVINVHLMDCFNGRSWGFRCQKDLKNRSKNFVFVLFPFISLS